MSEEFKSKNTLIKLEDGLIRGINEFLKDLLINTELEGIIALQQIPAAGTPGYAPAIITDPESLDNVNVLAPIMPINSAKAVSDYTRLQPSQKMMGVVLRPCESRALVELVKLKQASLENLIIIGIDCPGTTSIKSYSSNENERSEKKSKASTSLTSEALIEYIAKSEDHPELRSACQACEYFTPDYADIIIGLYGLVNKKNFLLSICSTSAQELLEPLKLSFDNKPTIEQVNVRNKSISKLKERRLKFTKALESNCQERIHGLDNFMTEFSNCINCHNCMTVCPICYCKECFFESPTFDLEADKYLQMAQSKGSFRIPSNMFLFHVTRFNHMVLSCISCGMCEQGCPANIPLLSIYKTVGRNAQNVFDYVPGRSLDEEIPILTFQEDELEPK